MVPLTNRRRYSPFFNFSRAIFFRSICSLVSSRANTAILTYFSVLYVTTSMLPFLSKLYGWFFEDILGCVFLMFIQKNVKTVSWMYPDSTFICLCWNPSSHFFIWYKTLENPKAYSLCLLSLKRVSILMLKLSNQSEHELKKSK